MRSTNLPVALVAILAIYAIVRTALAWPDIPPTMASHFDLQGRPDGWMNRNGFFLLYGAIAGVTVLLLVSAPLWLRWMPAHLINLPNRNYWVGVATAALMIVILEDVVRANVTRAGLGTAGFLIMMGAYLAVIAALTIALVRRFRLPSHPKAEVGGSPRPRR